MVDAIKAAKSAKEALSEAKERIAKGELSADSLQDYELNLAAATAANSAPTLGFTANGKATHSTNSTTQSQGQWNGTELNGAVVNLQGDDFTGQGLTSNSQQLLLNINKLALTSGTNHSTSSSNSSSNSQTASLSSAGNVGANVSGSKANSNSQAVEQLNSTLNTGDIQGDLDVLSLKGGRINAQTGDLTVKDLDITTQQNTATSNNGSRDWSVGISGVSGGVSGGSLGITQSKSSSDSAISIEQIGIVFGSDQHQLTVDNTENSGGIIAHIESNANGEAINKTLNFTTKTIKTTDIKDHATSEQRSLGVNVGINNAKDKGTSKNEQSLGTSSINASHSGHDYQATTQATIDEGAVVSSDTNALASVNRDVNTATVITKNQDVGGLNANVTVDSRLFTEAGRAQIKAEQAEVGVNIQKTGEILGDAISTGVLKGAEVFMENKTDAAKIAAKIDAKLIKMGIPTKENGGLYSEIPIVLGGDDTQQKPYLIVGSESEKYKKNPKMFMPVKDMAGYDDLPQQSKDQSEGLYISKEAVQITADTATHQNFVNGMLNSKTEAMVNGLQQTFGSVQNGAKNTNVEYTLNFNQSKGYLSDGLEAGVDKVAGMDFFGYRPLSWFNSGASDAAGQNANAVINLLPRANFAQHSQGNLLINAALPEFMINKTAEQMQTNGRFNFTFNGYGSPVNNVDFSNGL